MVILITGGIKAGKSRRALELALEWPFPVSFVATAEVLDDEMRERIARHREERAGLAAGRSGGFVTVEEPLELDRATAAAGERAVVDCIPMWVNNLMYYRREADFGRILEGFTAGIRTSMRDCVIVTNETGLGNVPFDESTRRYNMLLAEANRKIAAAADRVELMVCGIPLRVK
ncbi:MAG: bifunctional adenosylcobinamide kinase/adenosylcobinamide-phosphate guanylyltransferase [Treponema sp.]|jgi:adenosylcobinamide kinase/adenosylcobinamide-phosphate guanylyltransferase|nr:bifunctional adenosylcobinamide kinase/adenosylcobinamide-phosphate guanylyltransferase [Treponema sp.]